MNNSNNDLSLNYSKAVHFVKESRIKEALNYINTISNHEKNFDLISLKGSIYLKLGEFKNSYYCYSLAIKLNKNSFNCLISRALALFELGEFKKSIEDFQGGLKINNKSSAVYENIGKCYANLGDNEKAINYFHKALNLDPENNRIIEMIAEKLSYTNLETKTKSVIVNTDYLIKKIKHKSFQETEIKEIEIKNLFNEANNLIKINFNNLIFNQTQIFRKNNFDLNCDRHFLVFGNFKVIPEFCFSCIKITIDVENVLDLTKLFFIFNSIKLKNNNLRKCMIDLRSNSKTNYKGFIYCRSIDEAKEIKINVDHIVQNNISKKIFSNIKRGCTEFNKKYPGYENISKNTVSYNSQWKNYEKLIDERFPKFQFMKKNQITLKRVSFYDIMVIRNWLYFAKIIKDNTYKKISNDLYVNPSLEKIIKRNKFIN